MDRDRATFTSITEGSLVDNLELADRCIYFLEGEHDYLLWLQRSVHVSFLLICGIFEHANRKQAFASRLAFKPLLTDSGSVVSSCSSSAA